MSEEYLISQAAPTLAGLKTGNLFPCCYSSWSSLLKEIRADARLLSAPLQGINDPLSRYVP